MDRSIRAEFTKEFSMKTSLINIHCSQTIQITNIIYICTVKLHLPTTPPFRPPRHTDHFSWSRIFFFVTSLKILCLKRPPRQSGQRAVSIVLCLVCNPDKATARHGQLLINDQSKPLIKHDLMFGLTNSLTTRVLSPVNQLLSQCGTIKRCLIS